MTNNFESFLQLQGFRIHKPLIPGGGIQRYSNDKKRSQSCWAVLFPEGDAGVWGDWKDHGSHYWRQDGRERHQLNAQEIEEMNHKRKLAEDMLQKELQRLASINLKSYNAIEEGIECAYLAKKHVAAHGIKIGLDGNAYVPARDLNGKLWNYQSTNSERKLFKRGRMKGLFHLIEGNRSQIVIASGYATAASIHEATGLCTIVSFGDGNVFRVASVLKEAGWKNLVAAVDNDSGGSESGNKIGQKISDELGMGVIMPSEPGDFNDLACKSGNQAVYDYFFDTTPVFSFGALLGDKRPMPEDIIYPRVLTEGGMLVFGGAPKVGKSDFLLSWLANMSAGNAFMGMNPPRPLKIFYLQAEVQYDYLRERVQMLDMDVKSESIAEKNLFITPQVRMLLNEQGVKIIGNTIKQCFNGESPDIIAIDPISNLYDGESENDNAQMMKFLSERVEKLREYASDKTGFMLVHHTKKIAKDELAKDPFQMFSGASSLRRYYTTGMLMYRPDEEVSECVLTYEVRNGPRIKNIIIDKDLGRWVIVPTAESRIKKTDEQHTKDERARKVTILIDEIQFGMSQQRRYTVNSFAEYMAGKSGLGSSKTIERILKEMIAQGDAWNEPEEDGKRLYLTA